MTASTPTVDYRQAPTTKSPPRAVADAIGGTIIAVADIDAPPERVYRALTTNEVERWWGADHFYRSTEWKADLRVCGPWSVVVRRADGGIVNATGEFVELVPTRKIVMTRRFDKHPGLGDRETTLTYHLEPIPTGTRITLRDEGFQGRAEAARANAAHWELVFSWLETWIKSA